MEFGARLEKEKVKVFSLKDIQNLFPEANLKTVKNNLSHWLKKGYIRRIRRGLYELLREGEELSDFYIANRLYSPSYISLETALSYHNLIPEVALQVTSITPKPTREFKNSYGLFIYRSCQKRAFLGYRVLRYDGYKILIADKEKALVDFLYFKEGKVDFEGERFNKALLKKIDWKKARKYGKLFNRVTSHQVEECKRWAKC